MTGRVGPAPCLSRLRETPDGAGSHRGEGQGCRCHADCFPRCRSRPAPLVPVTSQNVLWGMVPRLYGRSSATESDLVVPEGGSAGVIVAMADSICGFGPWVGCGGMLQHACSLFGSTPASSSRASRRLPGGEIAMKTRFAAKENTMGSWWTLADAAPTRSPEPWVRSSSTCRPVLTLLNRSVCEPSMVRWLTAQGEDLAGSAVVGQRTRGRRERLGRRIGACRRRSCRRHDVCVGQLA